MKASGDHDLRAIREDVLSQSRPMTCVRAAEEERRDARN